MRPLTESEAKTVPETDRPALCVLSCLKSNYTAPIAPLYLLRRTDPDAAGVLEAYDLGAVKADSACRRQNELRAAGMPLSTYLGGHRDRIPVGVSVGTLLDSSASGVSP